MKSPTPAITSLTQGTESRLDLNGKNSKRRQNVAGIGNSTGTTRVREIPPLINLPIRLPRTSAPPPPCPGPHGTPRERARIREGFCRVVALVTRLQLGFCRYRSVKADKADVWSKRTRGVDHLLQSPTTSLHAHCHKRASHHRVAFPVPVPAANVPSRL